jgi:hypothetical protein
MSEKSPTRGRARPPTRQRFPAASNDPRAVRFSACRNQLVLTEVLRRRRVVWIPCPLVGLPPVGFGRAITGR